MRPLVRRSAVARPPTRSLPAAVACALAAAALAGVPARGAAQYPLAPSPVLALERLGDEVDFSGYVSMRETVRDDTASFGINRARLTAQARPAPWAAVRIQGDFSAVGRTRADTVPAIVLTDAYVQLVPPSDTGGRESWMRPALVVGQFKTPFSLEYLTSFASLPTADRSLAIDRLAPRRDRGALAALSAGRWATLWGAVVDGEGANATGNADARQLAMGRLSFFPLPIAALSGKWANEGSDHRWGFDARVVVPRVIVEGEYIRRSAPAADARFDGRGGYALAALRVLPWLQPVVKWERLRARTTSAAAATDERDTALTYGLNLLAPRDRVRLQLDWVDRSAEGDDSPDELIAQLQAIF